MAPKFFPPKSQTLNHHIKITQILVILELNKKIKQNRSFKKPNNNFNQKWKKFSHPPNQKLVPPHSQKIDFPFLANIIKDITRLIKTRNIPLKFFTPKKSDP